VSTAETASGLVVRPLPFRLRTPLGILFAVLGVAIVVPRVRAAIRLHSVVNRVADYGLCMAGPTGASAISEDIARFRLLVRRRLVASSPSDRPFLRCAALAREIAGRSELGVSHEQLASDFIEWGGGGQKLSENELFSVLPDLDALHRGSWPLVRKPLTELLRPSRGAYEAVHSMDLDAPTPVTGLALDGAILRSGLDTPKGRYVVLSSEHDVWAYRSRDQGHSWIATSAWQSLLDGHANHCVAASVGQSYALPPPRVDAAPALLLGNLAGIGGERREFGSPNDSVKRVACDETGAVALTQERGQAGYRAFACPSTGRCRELELPPLAQQRDVSIDVARVGRVIVVALAKDGLVRVTTFRDEGVTRAPLSLVFDAHDSRLSGLQTGLTVSLLGIGQRLYLTLAPRKGSARWALASDDRGASFHAL
jgi:hypothetical protein